MVWAHRKATGPMAFKSLHCSPAGAALRWIDGSTLPLLHPGIVTQVINPPFDGVTAKRAEEANVMEFVPVVSSTVGLKCTERRLSQG